MKIAVITSVMSGVGIALTHERLHQGRQVVALVWEESSKIEHLPSSNQVTAIPLSLIQMADTKFFPCLCVDSVF